MPAFDRLHGAYGPGSVIRRQMPGVRRAGPDGRDERPGGLVAGPDQHPGRILLDQLLEPEIFDELVDRVAERVERRLLEDLERRGERGVPGVF